MMPIPPPPLIFSILFSLLYLTQLSRLIQMGVKGNSAAQRSINFWSIVAFIPLLLVILNLPDQAALMQVVEWTRANILFILLGVVIFAEILIRQSAKENLLRVKKITEESNDPEELYTAAHELEVKKKYGEAIAIHKRILELDPEFTKSYVNMAALAGIGGQIKDAEQLARKAIEIDPLYPNAHFYLGMSLRDQGKIPESIKEFQTAIRLGLKEPLRSSAINQGGNIDEEETDKYERVD